MATDSKRATSQHVGFVACDQVHNRNSVSQPQDDGKITSTALRRRVVWSVVFLTKFIGDHVILILQVVVVVSVVLHLNKVYGLFFVFHVFIFVVDVGHHPAVPGANFDTVGAKPRDG